MSDISIMPKLCSGCEICVGSCPYGAISVVEGIAQVSSACALCGACVEACPAGAIALAKSMGKQQDTTLYSGVWVFAEQVGGQLREVGAELLGEGTRLAAELGTQLSAVLIGHGVRDCAKSLVKFGAHQVYLVDRAELERFNDELYADVLVRLVEQYKPEILLIGATAYGRSLAPRVASRLNTGLTADCTELDIDKEKRVLLQTRPAFGGNLMATIICPLHRPQMATVRPRVMKALMPDEKRTGKIVEVDMTLPEALRTRVIEVVQEASSKVNLTEADTIVAVGKGAGLASLGAIRELAEILGAVIGATRPVVDAGWLGYEHQIGQTGKTVCPRVYLACGVSGAVQHLAGMSGAELIIAINKDPEAPIFNVAHYGIVGDVMEVVPALIEELKSRK